MTNEINLILEKIKLVSEIEEQCAYICDKEHSKILYDYITNLQECCKDKIDRYQDMILKYCKLDEKYKKSCETYQQTLDETMSEKMNLEDKIKKSK